MARKGTFWGQNTDESLPEELLGRPSSIADCVLRLKIELRQEQRWAIESLLICFCLEAGYKLVLDSEAPGGRYFSKGPRKLYVCSKPDTIEGCKAILATETRPRNRKFLEDLIDKYALRQNHV